MTCNESKEEEEMKYQVGEFERGGRVRGAHCGVERLDQPAELSI